MLRLARAGTACAVAGALAILAFSAGTLRAADAVLIDAERYRVEAGRYSVFAEFQAKLQALLDACGKGEPAVVPPGQEARGRIGGETRAGVQRALECDALRDVPEGSAARKGAITASVWRAVMGPSRPLPDYRERTDALILSFEGTDFGERPEWNFCQDSKASSKDEITPRPGAACYNASDPCSFLTWGPRGATAGQGREIQWILWLAWKEDPAEVERAFGPEFRGVSRFFRLRTNPNNQCEHGAPLERFMCAVWLDPTRRKAWTTALADLGRLPRVRDAYARIYAHQEFDGAKLQSYADLWKRLGLRVSEVDYAFFMDRITHQGGPPADEGAEQKDVRACMAGEAAALNKNAAARRCLSRLLPHGTQPAYRLGRDVAFFLDAYPEGALSQREVKAWGEYIPLSAVHNFGLSDANLVSIEPSTSLRTLGPDLPLSETSDITRAEWMACPRNILFPASPR